MRDPLFLTALFRLLVGCLVGRWTARRDGRGITHPVEGARPAAPAGGPDDCSPFAGLVAFKVAAGLKTMDEMRGSLDDAAFFGGPLDGQRASSDLFRSCATVACARHASGLYRRDVPLRRFTWHGQPTHTGLGLYPGCGEFIEDGYCKDCREAGR